MFDIGISEIAVTAKYEDTEGSYHAEFLFPLFASTGASVSFQAADLLKVLSQSELLSIASVAEAEITVTVSTNNIHVSDENVDCDIPAKGETTPYTLTFKPKVLKDIISNSSESTLAIKPLFRASEADAKKQIMTGIHVDSNKVTMLLPATKEVEV